VALPFSYALSLCRLPPFIILAAQLSSIRSVFMRVQVLKKNWGSSVSTVGDFRLDDGIWTRYFSSTLCVQTGCGAHPASRPKATGNPFSGCKLGRRVMLTTRPHLVLRSRTSMSLYLLSLHAPPWRVARQPYLYLNSNWSVERKAFVQHF
jgi:hypothetical protein